ncbi:unnamed protein product [Heligmosomoides polygyrus]|uniref:Ras-associating domain-containing protein n=1 Tax=Heligmosomoides polygyrus TaxID=6339 RepID=A0A183GNS0_HELPZ|nr:unnamed protein product [Heligmosomoides polygyrus]
MRRPGFVVPSSNLAAWRITTVGLFQVSSTVVTVGNCKREITDASFSFIRHHLILAASHRSTCCTLGCMIFKAQTSDRCCGATVSYGTIFAILHKDRVYLSHGASAIERDEVEIALKKYGIHNGEILRFRILKNALTIGVTRPVSETSMTTVPSFAVPMCPLRSSATMMTFFGGTSAVFSSSRLQNSSLAWSEQLLCGAYAEKK